MAHTIMAAWKLYWTAPLQNTTTTPPAIYQDQSQIML